MSVSERALTDLYGVQLGKKLATAVLEGKMDGALKAFAKLLINV